MRVLVTGSVTWADPTAVETALNRYLRADESMTLITGMATGADEAARRWAARLGVPVLAEELTAGRYPEPMHRYNERMLGWGPDVVLAFKATFDPVKAPLAGTEHMCSIAAAAGVVVRVFDSPELQRANQ